MKRYTKLTKTIAFKLICVYLLIFAASVGIILAWVWWNTEKLLESQTDETIRAEITALSEQFRQGGFNNLIATVQRRSKNNPDQGIYYFARNKEKIDAGNINQFPAKQTAGRAAGWVEFPYVAQIGNQITSQTARAYFEKYTDGTVLLVGRNIAEQRQFTTLIRAALLWGIVLTIAIGTIGGIFVSRNFLKRIEGISLTTQSIMGGDFSERIQLNDSGDELDRLSKNLNDMLDKIEKLMRGMREVSDNIAHDLKTPLTRLRARIDSLLRQNITREQNQAVQECINDIDQLLQIFDDLLNIARAEAGYVSGQKDKINTTELITELIELYAPVIEDMNGKITFNIQKEVILYAYRQLLTRALANLLDNVIKYAKPPKGHNLHVEINVQKKAKDKIEISIADNGQGIKLQDHDRALERFTRLDNSRSLPGSGLGLSLVAGVANLHQGECILAENNPQNTQYPGLKISLILPVENQEKI